VPEVEPDNPPDAAGMERLAGDDPVAFLKASLARYDHDVRGYRTTLVKRERVHGKLRDPEEIDVSFREKPFSVRIHWIKGATRAERTLFAHGQYGNQLLVHLQGRRFVKASGA
jgi:hypothetical protein